MQAFPEQRSWLSWLIKVRILVLTLLLGIQLAVVRLTPTSLPLRPFLATIFLWYTISLFFLALAHFWEEYRAQSALQVATDLALSTLLIYVTGGVDSWYNFFYPLVIVVGCILLPRTWAYTAAAMAFILYGVTLELAYFEVIPSYASSHPDARTLLAIILVNLCADLAIAYLASHLAHRLRQMNLQLRDTSGALEDLQALHQNILQSISNGLLTTGLDGRVKAANAAACEVLGLRENELVGKPVQSLFLDSLPFSVGGRAHAEVRCQSAQAEERRLDVRMTPLTVPEKGLSGYVFSLEDITEVRRLEREVRLREQQAAIGRMGSAIAHEIRNPLASIGGSVKFLSGVAELGDEHRLLVDIVARESERLNAILSDFLAFSKGPNYEFATVNVVPLLEQALDQVDARVQRRTPGIRVERSLRSPEALVLGDSVRLQQAFCNLAQNAIDAMCDGGTLNVVLQRCGSDWQIRFTDTGPRLTPQQAERVFEPFQTQNDNGTGLTLAIVYQIVQAHEGSIRAYHDAGNGNCFELLLPGQEKSVAGLTSRAASAGAGGGANG